MKTSNNNRERIINLMENATDKIQVAVSWLTDEQIINKMTEMAKRVKVELLLSCDPLNAAFRYADIRNMQRAGAKVLKVGANFPGEKGFMHAKFIIIDDTMIYGGSFNYTNAATYNYEIFGKFDADTLRENIKNYALWMKDAIDYVVGFENPAAINELVLKQFKINEEFRSQMMETCEEKYKDSNKNEITEREILIKQELHKEKLRKEAEAITNRQKGIEKNGAMTTMVNAVRSKPHRFYGGNIRSDFGGKKQKNSYAAAYYQKTDIEKKFDFLKCRIQNDTLICTGTIHPNHCSKYNLRIEYRAGSSPQVYILNHKIKPDCDIHMYNNNSLCLYYPGDLQWKVNTAISEHTIPWVYEWVIFYELYKQTGKWEGNFVPHRQNITPFKTNK